MPHIRRKYFTDIYKEIFVIYYNNESDELIDDVINYVYKKCLDDSFKDIGRIFTLENNQYYYVMKTARPGVRYKHSIYIYKINFKHKDNLQYEKLLKEIPILSHYEFIPSSKGMYFDKNNLSYFTTYKLYKDLLKLKSNKDIDKIFNGKIKDLINFLTYYKFSKVICNLYYLKTPDERLDIIKEFLTFSFNITHDTFLSEIIPELAYLSSIKKYNVIANNLLSKLIDKINNDVYILSDTQIATYKDSFNKKNTDKIYKYINNKVDLYSQIDPGGFIGILNNKKFFISDKYKYKKRKILIISEQDDLHVQKVLSFIDQDKYHVDIFGINDLENDGYVDTLSEMTGEFFDTDKRYSRVYDICWWRKPIFINSSEKYLKNINLSNIAKKEKIDFLEGVILNIPIRSWINNISDMKIASNKIHQLNVVEINIPKTVITNKKEIIKKIFQDKFVMKTLKSQSLGLEEGVLKTTLTNIDDIDKIDLNFMPVICQEFIDKICDIRVTIIGNKLFSAKIYPLSEKAKIDFRSDYNNLKHEVFKLPKDIEKSLLAINKYYNLNYSAIDLIEDKNGNIYFLEINPNGQYLWIEETLGLPISEAIASFLKGEK
jgi:hypothetical protein